MFFNDACTCSYDQHGKDGVEEAPKMDPGALYAMIFGSEKFEPLIGARAACAAVHAIALRRFGSINSTCILLSVLCCGVV